MSSVRQAVWITRPAAQSAHLAALVAQRGYEPLVAPLLKIEPRVSPQEAERVAAKLSQYAWVFFVSANAALIACEALSRYGPWPKGLAAASVGKASAEVLKGLGVEVVLVPEHGSDSEALLAAPWASEEEVRGKRILIIQGEGGRDLVAKELARRGALIDRWVCYRRSPASWDEEVAKAWDESRLQAVLITSSEAARYGPLIVPHRYWEAMREGLVACANHQRVAEALSTLGWKRIVVAEAVGDEPLLASLNRALRLE